jgi:hypothetical protein
MVVTARGTFQTRIGAPSRNASVSLEMFDAKRGEWVGVGEGKTDSRGRCSVAADAAGDDFLPALRLRQTRSGQILDVIRSAKSTRGRLTVDFGVDERSTLKLNLDKQATQLATAVAARKQLDGRLLSRTQEVSALTAQRDSLAKTLRGAEKDLSARSDNLVRSEAMLKQTTSERDSLKTKLAKEVAAHAALKVSYDDMADQRDGFKAQFSKSQSGLTALGRRLTKSQAASEEANAELRRVKATLVTAQSKLVVRRRELEVSSAALKKVTSERDGLSGRLAKSVAALDSSQERLKIAEEDRDLRKKESKQSALEVDRWEKLSNEAEAAKRIALDEVASNADRLDKADTLRGELLTEVLDLRKQAHVPVVVHQPIDQVVSDLGAEIQKASSHLGDAGVGFELASVNVKLHGLLDANGTSIALDDHDAIATSGSHLELTFQHAGAAGSDLNPVSVPSVIGLTPVAARRLLQDHRLDFMASTSPLLEADSSRHGQAKLQSPAAGTSISAGALVHVVFVQSADDPSTSDPT